MNDDDANSPDGAGPHEPSLEADFGELVERALLGNPESAELLYQRIYGELRTIAGRLLREKRDVAEPTSLVHEGFMRLFGRSRSWPSKQRSYFFFSATRVMRDVLAERLRSSKSKAKQEPLDEVADDYLAEFQQANQIDFLQLHKALERFSRSRNERKRRRHQLIEMVFLGGMHINAAAELMGISYTQARDDLRLAKAELRLAVASEEP